MTPPLPRRSRTQQTVDRVFLTVILWPKDMTREALAALIAGASGMDQATVRLTLGNAPPAILGLVDPQQARRAIDAVEARGGEAFAPSLGDITAIGPTLKIKDMRIGEGALIVDLWRGQPTRIEFSAIELLVRARLREETKKPWTISGGSPLADAPMVVGTSGWGWGGAHGLAAGLSAGYIAHAGDDFLSGTTAERSVQFSNKLDIHAEGKVFQIDGDKFGFGLLGELRGHSDSQNTDAMCELLAKFNADVIVDPYFSLWTPPAGHQRLRLPQMIVNNDDPAFAFYSRWAALMYRHLSQAKTS